mmetsp:Transcript_3870/g.4985  ORF Transcript_3870/g.4985 Transcript_3870/m.4985 type:complete len:103 (+) Transcript_3870:904-1212(+)
MLEIVWGVAIPEVPITMLVRGRGLEDEADTSLNDSSVLVLGAPDTVWGRRCADPARDCGECMSGTRPVLGSRLPELQLLDLRTWLRKFLPVSICGTGAKSPI